MANAYDVIRYPSRPFWQTHPAALGAFAALFGKRFTPLSRARVLEIGCGEGVNLLNIALWAPSADCVGVDLAQEPIALARATAEATGIANARFLVQDILEMDAALGAFDYIIAHGVYAWVPDAVREAIMGVIGRSLAPDGLAYLSYNAFPGCRLRMALRDLLLDATRDVFEPGEKIAVARAVLTKQLETWSADDPDQIAMIAGARQILDRQPESLFHDELSAFFSPQYLADVVAAARALGLEYLCDTQPPLIAEAFLPSPRYAAARERAGDDWVRFEQLRDFDDVRAFRSSVFCRSDGGDRHFASERLRGLWVAGHFATSEADPSKPDESAFRVGESGMITTNNPKLAQLLSEIAAAFPSFLPLDGAADDRELAMSVLQLFAKKCVTLSTAAPPLSTTPGESPRASPLARFQARQGEKLLTALNQRAVLFEDEAFLDFVPLVDGARTRADLAAELSARLDPKIENAAAQVSEMLKAMAGLGLLAS